MKKYYKKLIVILLVYFIIPQIALAVWWNPFSWNIWNKIFHRTDAKTQASQPTPIPATSGQSILAPKTTETNKKPENTVLKTATETNTRETEAYRKAILEAVGLIASKYKIEHYFCKGMVDFANLRIENREKLRVNILDVPDEEIASTFAAYYENDKKPAEEMRDSFTQLENMIQDQLNALNNFSNEWTITKGTISKNDFNEAINKVINPHSKLVISTWDTAEKLALGYKNKFDESDKFVQDSLAKLIALSKSVKSQDIPPSIYVSHNNFSEYNFLDYVYKTQQLEVLQNINDNLLRIANNY